MSNELTTNVPAHIAALMQSGDKYTDDLGRLKPSDLAMNLIKLCQTSSREFKPNWGPQGNEAPLPEGTMFFSKNHQIIPVGTKFIPLIRDVTYIRWSGRAGGDAKIVFATHDPNDERITKFKLDNGTVVNSLDFLKDPTTGETRPPLTTEYTNFYVATNLDEDIAILSFARTASKIGRKLTQAIFSAKGGSKLPMCALQYQFDTPTTIPDGSNSWKGFNITPCGFVPAEVLPKMLQLVEQAKVLASAASGAEFDDSSETETATTTQQTQQPQVQTIPQPPQVQQAPVQPPAPPIQQPALVPQISNVKKLW